jgi:hypothetical protein
LSKKQKKNLIAFFFANRKKNPPLCHTAMFRSVRKKNKNTQEKKSVILEKWISKSLGSFLSFAEFHRIWPVLCRSTRHFKFYETKKELARAMLDNIAIQASQFRLFRKAIPAEAEVKRFTLIGEWDDLSHCVSSDLCAYLCNFVTQKIQLQVKASARTVHRKSFWWPVKEIWIRRHNPEQAVCCFGVALNNELSRFTDVHIQFWPECLDLIRSLPSSRPFKLWIHMRSDEENQWRQKLENVAFCAGLGSLFIVFDGDFDRQFHTS